MPKEKKGKYHGIYVGNLPADLNKEDVESLFEKYNVKACDFHRSGKKIFCFMKLPTVANVRSAIREMDRKDINGRKLVVREFEDKRRTSKPDQGSCKDSDCHNSSIEDTVPPLETPSVSQNTSFNDDTSFEKLETSSEFQSCHHGHLKLPTSGHSDSSDHLSSQVQNSCHNYSNSFLQLNGRMHPSEMKESSFHLPKPRTTHSDPKHKERKATRNQNRSPQQSADLSQPLNKSSEKFPYVHCTRNVISYNPRHLQTSEINNSWSYPSEAVSVQVVNFPFGTTKTQILKLFEDFSPINAYIDNNKPGSDYTQATVTLPSLDAAEAAIMELDNTMYRRRALIVTLVDDELDEFADGYDEEEEYDEGDDSYYGSESQYSEQGNCCRPSREQYGDRQLSRRFNGVHIS